MVRTEYYRTVTVKDRNLEVVDLSPVMVSVRNICWTPLYLIYTRYANEVGEAFRPLIHKFWVNASYGLASLYVLADTADKTIAADRLEKRKAKYNSSKVITAAVDTLLWQGLASIIIPGFTINRICALTLHSLSKLTKLPVPARKWTTTAVGLGSIPFIVTPIDTLVHTLLDRTFRPFFGDE